MDNDDNNNNNQKDMAQKNALIFQNQFASAQMEVQAAKKRLKEYHKAQGQKEEQNTNAIVRRYLNGKEQEEMQSMPIGML